MTPRPIDLARFGLVAGCLVLAACSLGEGPSIRASVVERNGWALRVDTHGELGFPLAGRSFHFESRAAGRSGWTRVFTYRDDANGPEPQDRVRFVSDRIAVMSAGWIAAVSADAGRTWNIWNAERDIPGWQCCNQDLVRDVEVDVSGEGRMHLEPAPGRNEPPLLVTADFGRTSQVPSEAPADRATAAELFGTIAREGGGPAAELAAIDVFSGTREDATDPSFLAGLRPVSASADRGTALVVVETPGHARVPFELVRHDGAGSSSRTGSSGEASHRPAAVEFSPPQEKRPCRPDGMSSRSRVPSRWRRSRWASCSQGTRPRPAARVRRSCCAAPTACSSRTTSTSRSRCRG